MDAKSHYIDKYINTHYGVYEIVKYVFMSGDSMLYHLIVKDNKVILAWSHGEGYSQNKNKRYLRGYYAPCTVKWSGKSKTVEDAIGKLTPSTIISRMANNHRKQTIFMSYIPKSLVKDILPNKVIDYFRRE